MRPVSVPKKAQEDSPHLRVIRIGPPKGINDDQCGTVEALVGPHKEVGVFDGAPCIKTYWRPSQEELEFIASGGVIELCYFSKTMLVTSMNTEYGDEQNG
jgi:hypothetical protein